MSSEGAPLPARARIVVVGGGVIGCSVAYHLAEAGEDVLLLERDRLTSGTTWHAAGLMATFGSLSETSTALRRYTRDLYARLEAETGQSTGLRQVGLVELATDADRLEEYRRIAAFNRYCGVDVHEIAPDEVAKLFPPAVVDDVLAGFYVPQDGRANPVDVTMALAKGARLHGATLLERTPVLGVLTAPAAGGRRVVRGVRTALGDVEAEVVVNCAGMWARQLGEARRRGAAATGGRALLPDRRRRGRRDRRPSRARGPGRLRVLPGGDRRPDGRPLRAGRGAVAARRHPGGLLVRHAPARLGADDAVARGRHAPRAGQPHGRRPDVLLRSRELHPRPGAAARRDPRGRRLLRRCRHELDRHPDRRRDRAGAGPLDRRRSARRRRHRHDRRAGAALAGEPRVPPHPHRRGARNGLRAAPAAPADAHGTRREAFGVARPAGGGGRVVPRRERVGGRALVRGAGGRAARARADLGAAGLVRPRRRRTPRRARGGRPVRHVVHGEVPRAGAGRRGAARARVGEPRRRRLRAA